MELTREALDAELVKLQALADSVTAKRGSAAKRLQQATETVLGADVVVDDVSILSFMEVKAGEDSETFSVNLGDLATFVQNLDEWAAHVRDEAVRAYLRAQGAGEDVEAVKAEFDKQRDIVNAYLTLLPSTGVDVSDVELPTLRSGRTSTASNTRKPGTVYAHFYRVINGARKDMPTSQDTLASVAWYYGAKITGNGTTNQGKGVTVGDLTNWLNKNGVESPLGKDWSVEVDGVTYGMERITVAGASEEE